MSDDDTTARQTEYHPTQHQDTHDQHHSPRVTIRDVAEAAGVAPSTVSRAFARPGRVSAQTTAHIREVAQRLGYRAGAVTAQRMSDTDGKPNGLLAIVVADLRNPVYADYTRSAQHQCLRNGYGLMVIDSEETDKLERAALQTASRHIDGIILASSRLSDAGIRKLAEIKPLVAINRSIQGIQSVIADPTNGMEEAISRLAQLGHESLSYLAGPESSWQDGIRWRALTAICGQYGVRLRRISSSEPTFHGGFLCGEAFVQSPTSAVLAYNDIMAIGFIASLQARRIAVPTDVSVIGIDDIQLGALVTPTLSTVHLARYRAGETAVEEVLAAVRHTNNPHNRRPIMFESRFVERDSIGIAR